MPKTWSEEDRAYFIANYGKIPMSEISKVLNRKEEAIREYAHRHKISANRYYTAEEEEFIVENYGLLTQKQIASRLKRPLNSVKNKIKTMGLGRVIDNTEDIHIREWARITGIKHSTLGYYETQLMLKTYKKGKYVMCSEKEMCRFLKNNPDRYDATKCETWFFDKYPWFHEKLLEDRRKKYDRVG